MDINKFKDDILKYKFNRKIEVDDKLEILLIEDSKSIESIPLEMIHGYYVFRGHISIYLENSSNTINIPIKNKLLKQAV